MAWHCSPDRSLSTDNRSTVSSVTSPGQFLFFPRFPRISIAEEARGQAIFVSLGIFPRRRSGCWRGNEIGKRSARRSGYRPRKLDGTGVRTTRPAKRSTNALRKAKRRRRGTVVRSMDDLSSSTASLEEPLAETSRVLLSALFRSFLSSLSFAPYVETGTAKVKFFLPAVALFLFLVFVPVPPVSRPSLSGRVVVRFF